jgi:nicotinamide-nucleotide amidase
VQPRIQGDTIRVSSREKDLLQQVIAALKASETLVPLQFINYRGAMPPDPEIFSLATTIGEKLRRQRRWLAVAESCTGGLLGAALTDVPGSSAYFLGGVISYAARVKIEQLRVPEEMLRQYGAVSEPVAAAMAAGVRQLLRADIGVSITGVAGPDAEGSKPVGLTFIGIAAAASSTQQFQWTGDRWDNRRRSVVAALELLVQALGH